jgi:hypothetical protein
VSLLLLLRMHDMEANPKLGVWYQLGEFFEEVADDVTQWWRDL